MTTTKATNGEKKSKPKKEPKAKKGAKADAATATEPTAADAAATSPEEIAKKKADAEKGEKKVEKRPDLLSTGYEDLFVKFSDEEKQQKGLELAQVEEQIEAQKDRIKSVSKQMRVDLEKLESQRRSIAGTIRSGGELRDVKIETVADWKRGTAKVVRLDTMEVVRDRILHASERQMGLPLEDGAVTGKAKTKGEAQQAAEPKKDGDAVAGDPALGSAEKTSRSMQQALSEEGPGAEAKKQAIRDELERQGDEIVGSDVDGGKPQKRGEKRRRSTEGEGNKPFNQIRRGRKK